MDVTNLAKLVQENSQLIDALIDLLPAPIFIKDAQGRYLQYNSAFAQLLGLGDQEDQLLGKTLLQYSDQITVKDLLAREAALLQESGCRIDEVDCTQLVGKPAILHFHTCATRNSQGETTGLVGIVFDITARVELERKLEQLSQIDELTGIANRRHGMARLDASLAHATRHSFELSLLVLDIDHFKQINDRFGHRAGDEVLKKVSQLVDQLTRASDTLFRYGGEEFVVILPNTHAQGAMILGDRFRQAIESCPFELNGSQTTRVTASVGVASFPDDARDTTSLFLAADTALYLAKNSGRNRTVHYRDRLEESSK